MEIRGCCWESATGDCYFPRLPRGVSLQCQAGENDFACGKYNHSTKYPICNYDDDVQMLYQSPVLCHAGASNDSNASEDMCVGAGCCWNEVAMPHSPACTIVHYDLYLALIPFSPAGSGPLLY